MILIDKLVPNTKQIIKYLKTLFFGIVITWLIIIQTLRVGGVLETSGPPFDDGHRDFED